MELCRMFDDGKPQSGASHFLGAAFVHTVKPLKNTLLMLCRNTDPCIGNRDCDAVLLIFNRYKNAAVPAVILNRIIAEIVDNTP